MNSKPCLFVYSFYLDSVEDSFRTSIFSVEGSWRTFILRRGLLENLAPPYTLDPVEGSWRTFILRRGFLENLAPRGPYGEQAQRMHANLCVTRGYQETSWIFQNMLSLRARVIDFFRVKRVHETLTKLLMFDLQIHSFRSCTYLKSKSSSR